MAASSRATNAALAEQLRDSAHRFDFFQAVRVLEAIAREHDGEEPASFSRPVGYDASPSDELVRFRAVASYNFAQSDVHSLSRLVPGQNEEEEAPPNLSVSFLGLFGPNGALPRHFTRSVIEQNDRKNYVLRDFLDLFNHRAIALFYRAWEKYRLPAAYERSRRSDDAKSGATDLFTQCLLSLVGFGAPALRSRLETSDQAFVYYAGHFAHAPRSALALQQVLSDYFSFDVQIQQFQGEWLTLTKANQSSLQDGGFGLGAARNNRLGVDTIAGERVWAVESKFRIRVGPVGYRQYRRLMPGGEDLVRLAQLTRSFVGPTLDFDIQAVLLGREAPFCQLGGAVSSRDAAATSDDAAALLGYNTWLFSTPPNEDISDGVFRHSGAPTRGTAPRQSH